MRDNGASASSGWRRRREPKLRLRAATRSGARKDGMANICEPLINVVIPSKPKVLTGLDQNGTWSEQGLVYLLPQTRRPPANRRSLTHSANHVERGKSVVLQKGTAPREGRPMGRRTRDQGHSEGRSVMGWIEVEPRATSPHAKAGRLPRGPWSRESLTNRPKEQSR